MSFSEDDDFTSALRTTRATPVLCHRQGLRARRRCRRTRPRCWSRPRCCGWCWCRGSCRCRRSGRSGRRRGCRRATRRGLDRSRDGRSCLEEADHCIGTLRRLIGIKPEVIQCAPADRVGVLVLRKGFGIPRYGIGGLSDIPRCAAVTLVVKCAVVCPAGFLRRGMKSYVTNVDTWSQGNAK